MRILAAITCAVSMATGLATAVSTEIAAAVVLDRFLNSATPALTSYQARRVLTASAMGGRMTASLEAWTELGPDGTFSFTVIRQEGSGLVRKHALVAALNAEQHSRNSGEAEQTDLTPANYDLRVEMEPHDEGLAIIRLAPRRKAPMLLNGTVTVTRHDGDMLRVDGSPSKPPSWWTTRVDIVRRYQRIGGVRVPIEMSSRADIRLAGVATFLMTYEYTTINGQPVADPQAQGDERTD